MRILSLILFILFGSCSLYAHGRSAIGGLVFGIAFLAVIIVIYSFLFLFYKRFVRQFKVCDKCKKKLGYKNLCEYCKHEHKLSIRIVIFGILEYILGFFALINLIKLLK